MAKKLEKAQKGKIIKSIVKSVTKIPEQGIKKASTIKGGDFDIDKNTIKTAITLSERATLKEKLKSFSSKPSMKTGGAFDKYKSKKK